VRRAEGYFVEGLTRLAVGVIWLFKAAKGSEVFLLFARAANGCCPWHIREAFFHGGGWEHGPIFREKWEKSVFWAGLF
jgi:hypothetical protein